jgi:hypothetical protein
VENEIQKELLNSLEPLLIPHQFKKDFVEDENEVLIWKNDGETLRNLIIYDDGAMCLSIININDSGKKLSFFESTDNPEEIVKYLLL